MFSFSGEKAERRVVSLLLTGTKEKRSRVEGGAENECVRVPIGAAISLVGEKLQRLGAGGGATHRVEVRGVDIGVGFADGAETRLMALLYEPHAVVRSKIDEVAPVGLSLVDVSPAIPCHDSVRVSWEAGWYEGMGLVSEHGPLMVRRRAGKVVGVDSLDGTLFEARAANHEGGPIGLVRSKRRVGRCMQERIPLSPLYVKYELGPGGSGLSAGMEMLLYVDRVDEAATGRGGMTSALEKVDEVVVEVRYLWIA